MKIKNLLAFFRKDAVPVDNRGWWPLIQEPFGGAWQQNVAISADTALAYHAVYSCVSLISADIGKLRLMLMRVDDDIWTETSSPAFSPVLKRPNRFQTHIQFFEWWMISKLVRGNTYVLLERDNRQVVRAMYMLDPCRVVVKVATDGAVYYDIGEDNLAGVRTQVLVPASEIIHDRMNCLFHPLVGISPLYASGLSADQGLKIQRNSSGFFANNSSPGGILTAPGRIEDELAGRLKKHWEDNYTGANAGRIAVLGDGLKFEPMRMTAVESQLIEQLKQTAEIVCSCFHVPPFLIGVGPAPTYNNVEALAQQYYTQCLQTHIESIETCLDYGLGLDTTKDGVQMGTEFDLGGLLRMDSATQMDTLKKAVDAAIMTPNEARRIIDLPPIEGGDTVYMQEQEHSLAALAARDAMAPPPAPLALPAPAPAEPVTPPDATQGAKDLAAALLKRIAAESLLESE